MAKSDSMEIKFHFTSESFNMQERENRKEETGNFLFSIYSTFVLRFPEFLLAGISSEIR
jgi:hypothetical protein